MSRALFWADVFQQDNKLREIDSLKYHYCIFIPFMLLVRMTCFIGHDSRQVCVEDVMSRYALLVGYLAGSCLWAPPECFGLALCCNFWGLSCQDRQNPSSGSCAFSRLHRDVPALFSQKRQLPDDLSAYSPGLVLFPECLSFALRGLRMPLSAFGQ